MGSEMCIRDRFLLDNLLPDQVIETFCDKAIMGFIDGLDNKKEI